MWPELESSAEYHLQRICRILRKFISRMQILLNGSSVEEGFGLCLRVVADCQLDGMEVLRRTALFLANTDNDDEVNFDEIERLSKCVEQSG